MRLERGSSTVVIMAGLSALLVQGFMLPPAAPPRPRLQAHHSSRVGTALPALSTAATGVPSNSTSGLSRTSAQAAAEYYSTELLLDLEVGARRAAPAVEAAGLLGTAADERTSLEEEEGCWMEDSAELLSKGAGAFGAGVKSVALASKPLKREASGRLVPDGQGLLNLCVLVLSGLWAVHSIVTVDASSWRGWTVQETLMRLPYANWDNYEMGLIEHPILTKIAINSGIYLIGDWLSQVNYGRSEDVALWEFDLKRTLRNGLIGALFGSVSHFYYDFSDWVLPPVGMNRPFKILMDQSVYFCSKCTLYISLVCLLRGDSLEKTRETLDERLKTVITTGWRVWPFVHIFTYFLIPPRHRVLWVNSVDLLWSSLLSGMTSGTPAVEGGSADPSEGDGGGIDGADTVEGTVPSSSSAPAAAAAGGVSAAAATAASAAVEKQRVKA